MFNIIPLILILISLSVIIVIVLKKFSVLANLDVENIQSEKEARFKEQIIGNRIKRNFYKYSSRIIRVFKPLGEEIGLFFANSYKKLLEFKENYNKEKILKNESDEQIIQRCFKEADIFIEEEKYDEAENRLIEVIGLDGKNVKAFRSLGNVYLFKKSFTEARQTLGHAIKLLEASYDPNKVIGGNDNSDINNQLASAYFDLTLANRETGDTDAAIESIDMALGVQPNNPRYLDTKFELSIIKKDIEKAEEAYEKLKTADPDNQKLNELKDRLDVLKKEKETGVGEINEEV